MAADLTPERRAMLRALYEASTHRSIPWYVEAVLYDAEVEPREDAYGIRAGCDETDDFFVTNFGGSRRAMLKADAEFCVEAHAVFPALLDIADEADALRAEVERLWADCDALREDLATLEDARQHVAEAAECTAEKERLRTKNRDLTELLRVHGRLDSTDEVLREADEALDERSEG